MVADLASKSLCSHQPSKPHQLDNKAEAIAPLPAPPLEQEHAKLTRNPYLRLPKAKLLAYVDVFVDDFLGLAQGPRHRRRHVRRTLFHPLDKVFRPLNRQDTKQHKEVLLTKKFEAGDCSWSTCQTMLGWIVDSVNMTISHPPSPPHGAAKVDRLLNTAHPTQGRRG